MDAEDIIDIIRRHRGWILGPVFAGLVIGVVTAYLWPETYVSSAVVRVSPAQVPERFVPTNVNADIAERVNAIMQSITSRPTLTNIINLYQLYPRDRKNLPLEDVIEQMRRDIRVRPMGVAGTGRNKVAQAYEISFAYENRHIAQKIVGELVTRFIDENIRTRSNQSSITTEFLRDQWEQRKRDLEQIDAKLTQFRLTNQGRLPEERGSLQSAVNMYENRISNLNSQIDRANQDKLLLESQINIRKETLRQATSATGYSAPAQVAKNERLIAIERQIQGAELGLEAMMEQYKDTHPDVQRRKSEIAVLKRRKDQLLREDSSKVDEPSQTADPQPMSAIVTKETRALEGEIAALQTQIAARDMQIENYRKDLLAIDKTLRGHQGRLEAMPPAVSEYEQLLREKQLAQSRYEEMNIKMAQSQSATELENRKQGETLELLDQASLPNTPTQPKRPMIIGAATAVGLALGLVLAGAREMKDTTLKNLKDVRSYTQLTVLGSIPLLENDVVVRRRRRLAWLAWTTACLAGVAIMAGSVMFYYTNRT
jgi:polysaccharide chain length determinant protein (PEP-CTERM system associated)